MYLIERKFNGLDFLMLAAVVALSQSVSPWLILLALPMNIVSFFVSERLEKYLLSNKTEG